MDKLRFEVTIDAPRNKVYESMLEDATYREWTSAFTPGSHYAGSWDKGATIKFLDPNGQGMIGQIEENRPNEYVSIGYRGFVKDGVDDYDSAEAKAMASSNAHENYTFEDLGGTTRLTVDLDTDEEYSDMFKGIYPTALAKLKAIAEK